MTLRYPELVVSDYSHTLMARYRWVFYRVEPSAYWYSWAVGSQSTVTMLIPLFFVNLCTISASGFRGARLRGLPA